MNRHSIVGASTQRVDALAKVKGLAKFSDDIRMDRMVYGKLLHSPYSHAKIRSIQIDGALTIPGILAVLLADDLYENKDCGETASWRLAKEEGCGERRTGRNGCSGH